MERAWDCSVQRLAELKFALKAVNCKRIFTLAKFRSAKVKEEFKATGFGETLVGSVEELQQLVAEFEKLLLFFQGSEEFCVKLKSRLSSLRTVRVIEICTNRRGFENHDVLLVHNQEIAHSKEGGITDGSWSLRSDLNLELQFTLVKRNLGLILRSTF